MSAKVKFYNIQGKIRKGYLLRRPSLDKCVVLVNGREELVKTDQLITDKEKEPTYMHYKNEIYKLTNHAIQRMTQRLDVRKGFKEYAEEIAHCHTTYVGEGSLFHSVCTRGEEGFALCSKQYDAVLVFAEKALVTVYRYSISRYNKEIK